MENFGWFHFMYVHIPKQSNVHMRTWRMHIHACEHTHTHTQTRTHAHTRTRTHTCTLHSMCIFHNLFTTWHACVQCVFCRRPARSFNAGLWAPCRTCVHTRLQAYCYNQRFYSTCSCPASGCDSCQGNRWYDAALRGGDRPPLCRSSRYASGSILGWYTSTIPHRVQGKLVSISLLFVYTFQALKVLFESLTSLSSLWLNLLNYNDMYIIAFSPSPETRQTSHRAEPSIHARWLAGYEMRLNLHNYNKDNVVTRKTCICGLSCI